MRDIHTYPEVNPFTEKTNGRIIGWWSGGVASAIACKLALEKYGDRVKLVFCDTGIEHPDTYRFMTDYEKVLGVSIERISNPKFDEPEDIWRKLNGLNFATGAPCSTYLKRTPRVAYQDLQNDFAQVFGFDYNKKEMRRATNMLINNPDLNPIFPLIVNKLDRGAIFSEVEKLGLTIPEPYKHFLNNNCIGANDSPKGGCVQGGIGYWQKIQTMYPKKFEYMANIEHELSVAKGKPVTICKDQRKATKGDRLFLKPSPDFPEVLDISVIKGRQPVTPFECNGFCSTSDE